MTADSDSMFTEERTIDQSRFWYWNLTLSQDAILLSPLDFNHGGLKSEASSSNRLKLSRMTYSKVSRQRHFHCQKVRPSVTFFLNYSSPSHFTSSWPVQAPESQVARIGEAAPDFTGLALLPSTEFAEISLDFTFVCPTEIIAFNNTAERFKAIHTEVVGLSTDSVYSHLAWVGTDRKLGGLGSIKIPLIGDLRATAIIDPDGIVQHLSYGTVASGRWYN
jgi:peroxiredoxin (alkyl hydroperoxide reductase subunit C)